LDLRLQPSSTFMTHRRLLLLAALVAVCGNSSQAVAVPVAPPTVTIEGTLVVEGNQGKTPFQTTIAATFYGGPIEVDVAAVSGTAVQGVDFLFEPIHLKLLPNQPQVITGWILGDHDVEAAETFTLRATASGGVASYDGMIAILDDDADPRPRVRFNNVFVDEGNGGWHDLAIDVGLDPPSTDVVTVDWQTMDGLQEYVANGQRLGEYQRVSGTVTFKPGEVVQQIHVLVNGDTFWERDTSFSLTFWNVHGAIAGPAKGVVTLKNDDRASTATLADASIVEGTGASTAVKLRFAIDPPAPPKSTVWIAFGGGAASYQDFTDLGTGTWMALGGETELVYPIEIAGDATPECDEGVVVTYQTTFFGDDGIKQARLLIVDDDGGDKSACGDPFTPPPSSIEPPPSTGGTVGTAGATATTGAAGAGGSTSSPRGTPTGLPNRGGCACSSGDGEPSWTVALFLVVAALWLRARRLVGAAASRALIQWHRHEDPRDRGVGGHGRL
jgi:MYXO-CTERM domain-containing protein